MKNHHLRSTQKWMPLSPEQEMFWLYYRLTGDSLNIFFKIELGPATNPAKVNESFNAVIAEHDIFWYQTTKYNARQQLGPVYRIAIEQGEFILKNREESDKMMKGLKMPFSLTSGPKIRATLMRNPGSSYTLYIATPHQVIDYITMFLFKKAFIKHLNEDVLPDDEAAPYSTYIAGLHSKEGIKQRRENLEYWKEKLKNAKPFQLQRAYIPTGTDNLRTVHLRLSPARFVTIAATSRSLAIPEPIYFYACIYTALHLLTGSPDFVFSFMFAVKRNGELANTFGPMIGLLPVSYSFSPDKSLTETIRQIYQGVKTAHKQKRFVPNIDLMSSAPHLVTRLPFKYRLLTGLYGLLRPLFGRHVISSKNMLGAMRKTKELGQPVFSKQATEPYQVMFNPRFSKDMRGEVYSSWLEDDTLSMGISADDETTDYQPAGIYFTINYDTKDYIELHSTPFINPEGQAKLTWLLEAILDQLNNNGSVLLKELAAHP